MKLNEVSTTMDWQHPLSRMALLLELATITYHGLAADTWQGPQNSWFCPNCSMVTEHKVKVNSQRQITFECSKCHNEFQAPIRVAYMKKVRRGGEVSTKRIVAWRMGMRRKDIVRIEIE